MNMPEPHCPQLIYLDLADFCKLARSRGLKFSRSHASRLALQGKLPAAKIKGRWFITEEDAEKFLEPRPNNRPRSRASCPTPRAALRRARAAVARIHFLSLSPEQPRD